jgi:flagellar motor protein MotB
VEQIAELSARLTQSEQRVLELEKQRASARATLADERRQREAVQRRVAALKAQLKRRFRELDDANVMVVSSKDDRMSVALARQTLFPEDSTTISPSGRVLLCELSQAIVEGVKGQIRVTGYYGRPDIESRPLAQRYRTSWELTASRAAAATEALVTACGTPTERLLSVGYGPRAAGPLGENVAFEFVLGALD